MRTQFFNGHWTGFEPIPVADKDIVKHGASASIKDFIAGQFSGTTPVTTGNDNMQCYPAGDLSSTDLDDFNPRPEIEDVLRTKQMLAAKEHELILKQQEAQKAARLAHDSEFARYKEYFEKSQAAKAQSNQSTTYDPAASVFRQSICRN